MERNNKIFWTKDYEIFKFLDGNRLPRTSTDFRHIKELALSIDEHGWWDKSHIITDKNLVIMDGQYRIWALKKLKESTGKVFQIGYEIDNDLALNDVQRINALSMKWNAMDYIFSYAKSGNKNYQFIKDIWENYHFPYSAILTLAGSGNTRARYMLQFKNGQIVISEKQKQKAIQYIEYIEQLAPYFSDYKSCRFIQAFIFFLEKDNFNFKEFLHKLDIRRDKLYPVSTVAEYKILIQDLYNFGKGKKITFIQA
jgi:hypothetical protein